MARPGVNVSSLAVTSQSDSFTDTGTFFASGVTEMGPTAPTLVRSMNEFTQTFGTRQSYAASMWDAADMFFRHGGFRLYVGRQVGPTPVLATLTLNDQAGTPVPTLRVDAVSYGAWGDNLTVAVTTGSAPDTFVLTFAYNGVTVEVTPDLATPAAAASWSQTSRYVRITDLASATTAPDNNPANLVATNLAGGADDHTNITNTQISASIASFDPDLGPGQVSVPGNTVSAVHLIVHNHAEANNRQAILDAPNTASVPSLIAAASAVRTAVDSPEYSAMFGPWLVVPGVTAGTTRTVAPSGVVAGLMAKQDAILSPNKPAAGNSGVSSYVLNLAQIISAADAQTLNDNSVNLFRVKMGTIRLYGYRTLALTGWVQLSNQRLRMLITAESLIIGEEYIFDAIDGNGLVLASFQGALKGILQSHFLAGDLFGVTPADAYVVDVASCNTPTTLANGELHAVLTVRMSPFAETVDIEIINVPITQSLV